MATIFIVDDEVEVHDKLAAALEGHRIISAYTGGMAYRLFKEHRDEIDIALMDGFLDRSDVHKNTLDIIGIMRRMDFKKPMIAMSRDERMLARQLDAGCSNVGDKRNIRTLVALVNSLTKK